MHDQELDRIRQLLAHPTDEGLDAAQQILRKAAEETHHAPAETIPEPPRPWALYVPDTAVPILEGTEVEVFQAAHMATGIVTVVSPYGCRWTVHR